MKMTLTRDDHQLILDTLIETRDEHRKHYRAEMAFERPRRFVREAILKELDRVITAVEAVLSETP